MPDEAEPQDEATAALSSLFDVLPKDIRQHYADVLQGEMAGGMSMEINLLDALMRQRIQQISALGSTSLVDFSDMARDIDRELRTASSMDEEKKTRYSALHRAAVKAKNLVRQITETRSKDVNWTEVRELIKDKSTLIEKKAKHDQRARRFLTVEEALNLVATLSNSLTKRLDTKKPIDGKTVLGLIRGDLVRALPTGANRGA